jgi:hypothetical protein
MVRRHLRSAVQGLAARTGNHSEEFKGRVIHRDSDKGRKIPGTVALYLEGKTPLDDE